MKPDDETYDTIDDLKVAVRTALTLSRSKGEIKLQEAQDYESPILEEHELHAQLNNHSIKWIPRMEIM